MKMYDLIMLKNEKPYAKYNLQKNMYGIVVATELYTADVLFFNPKNQGDYIIVKLNKNDIVKQTENLPEDIKTELNLKIENLKAKATDKFQLINIKAYDMVELMVESENYSIYGIHKGNKGCVMDDNAVGDYVEVDFSGIDDKGNFYGDCISVKTSDLKVIE